MTIDYKPARKMLSIAHHAEQQAPRMVETVDHIRRELANVDSFPTQTPGASAPTATSNEPRTCRICNNTGIRHDGDPCDECGPVHLTATERAAFTGVWFQGAFDEMAQNTIQIEYLMTRNDRIQAAVLSRRTPEKPKERGTCYANPSLAGYMVPLSEGGWADANCGQVSRTYKPGLCDRCRKNMERWRERTGQKQLMDDREVEYDSRIDIGEDGVAHALPIQGAA